LKKDRIFPSEAASIRMNTSANRDSVKEFRNFLEAVDNKIQIWTQQYVDHRTDLNDGRFGAVASVCNQRKEACWIGYFSL